MSEAEPIRDKTDPWTADERQNMVNIGTRAAEIEVEIGSLRSQERSQAWSNAPRDAAPQGSPRSGDTPDPTNPGDPTPVAKRDDVAQMRAARETARTSGWAHAIDDYFAAGFRTALREYVRSGEARMSEGSRVWLSEDATGGGYLVPPMPLVMMLIEEQRNNVWVEELSDVATVPGLRGHSIPRLDARPSDPEWTSETPADQSADDAMAFGRLRFEPHPMRGIKAEFSADEIEKDEVDIEATWRSNAQYLVGIKKENAYMTGDGVNKPVGIFVANAAGIPTSRDVKSGGASAITFQGLVNALFALKEQYQMRSTWVFGRKAMAQIFGLQDNDGRPIWQSVSMGPGGDFRGMILNRPYRLSEYVPNANKATALRGERLCRGHRGLPGRVPGPADDLHADDPDIYTKADNNIIVVTSRFYGDGKPKLAEAFARVQIGT